MAENTWVCASEITTVWRYINSIIISSSSSITYFKVIFIQKYAFFSNKTRCADLYSTCFNDWKL